MSRLCSVEVWSGSTPRAKEPLDSFEQITDGEADDLPEQAFLYVGGVEDVRKRAKEMA